MSYIIVSLLCVIHWSSAQPKSHAEYGFAHRVNDPDNIGPVLTAGANGIELDICSGYSVWSGRDWYVSHNDANLCNCLSCVTLKEWLSDLKDFLNNNPSKQNQLAMLWIDIKEPDSETFDQVPDIVHAAGLPSKIKILYDLTAFNDDSKNAFKQIVNKLNTNAGKSCGGDLETVKEIYDFYKAQNFKRGTFNTGDSANTDEDFIVYATSALFSDPSDPYRFKMVLTWTNSLESSIADHTNPYLYFTDGQIYDNFFAEWDDGDQSYIEVFRNLVNKFPDQERLGTAEDDPFGVEAFSANKDDGNIIDLNQMEFVIDNGKIDNKINHKFIHNYYQIMMVLSLVIIMLTMFICVCVYKTRERTDCCEKIENKTDCDI